MLAALAAICVIYRATEPDPPGAARPPAAAAAAAEAAAPLAFALPGAAGPAPGAEVPGPALPPQPVEVTVAGTAPAVPAQGVARTGALLELRREKRLSALEQHYEREAARRARLGLPPAPPPAAAPAVAGRSPRSLLPPP